MSNSNEGLLAGLRGHLVVSCQAASESPLAATPHIVALAEAAVMGGARAVRIEGIANVTAVRAVVRVPIIGIVKAPQPNSDVFITALQSQVDALCKAGADIVAFDATSRPRPEPVGALVGAVKNHGRIAMADISTLEEARAAVAEGADFVGTTLAGYTTYSINGPGADFALMTSLAEAGIPFAAEGRIWEPSEARRAVEVGAMFAVVGSAITRPDVITRRFAAEVANARITQNHLE
jgi:N-acylglucosamine-6-phosphate 2-epimerase